MELTRNQLIYDLQNERCQVLADCPACMYYLVLRSTGHVTIGPDGRWCDNQDEIERYWLIGDDTDVRAIKAGEMADAILANRVYENLQIVRRRAEPLRRRLRASRIESSLLPCDRDDVTADTLTRCDLRGVLVELMGATAVEGSDDLSIPDSMFGPMLVTFRDGHVHVDADRISNDDEDALRTLAMAIAGFHIVDSGGPFEDDAPIHVEV